MSFIRIKEWIYEKPQKIKTQIKIHTKPEVNPESVPKILNISSITQNKYLLI